MGTYLEDHPPTIRQYRDRTEAPSGVIVVHTSEGILDTVGPDTGAEGLARFIQARTTYGSYHTAADSDSRVRLVPYRMQAYGDGTGSNPHAIHIAAACAAADWPRMSAEQRDGFVLNLARDAADAAAWLRTTHGVIVPARRISREASEARLPGFIPHGDRDPARRTDPGAGFPWHDFLTTYDRLTEQETDPMADPAILAQLDRIEKHAERAAKQAQRAREGSYNRDRALIKLARETSADVDALIAAADEEADA